MSGDLENLMRLVGLGKKKAAAKPESLETDDPLTPDKEIEETVSKSTTKKEADKRRKQQIKWGGIAGAVLLLSFGIYLGMQPLKGSMAFGVCKTFIELNVRFPSTLRFSTVEELGTSVRVWYAVTDTFGSYRLELVQCYYKPDPSGQLPFLLDRIALNRRDLDSRKIDKFNIILPALFANPPDLTLPAPIPDSLQNMQIETDKFRMPIFGPEQ